MLYEEFKKISTNKLYEILFKKIKELQVQAVTSLKKEIIEIVKSKEELKDLINEFDKVINKYLLSPYDVIKLENNVFICDLFPKRIINQIQYLSNGMYFPNEILNTCNAYNYTDEYKLYIKPLSINKSALSSLLKDEISINIINVLTLYKKDLQDFISDEDKESLLDLILYNLEIEYYRKVNIKIFTTVIKQNKKGILDTIKDDFPDFYDFIIKICKEDISDKSIELDILEELGRLKF